MPTPETDRTEMIGRMALMTGWLNQARAAAHGLRVEVAALRAEVEAMREAVARASSNAKQPSMIDNDG